MSPLRLPPHEHQLTLYTPADIQRVCGVSRAGLRIWRRHPTFPKPLGQLSGLDVWDGIEVRAWHRERAGRPLRALRSYREHGNITRAAREAGADRGTVRKWLTELGEITPLSAPPGAAEGLRGVGEGEHPTPTPAGP